MTIAPDILDRFAAIVGEKHAIRDAQSMLPYVTEWRAIYTGNTPLVLRPDSTEQVSRIMALATETLTPIVPQSGNTGLVGAQIPHEDASEIVLSLDRMTRIRAVDADDNSITVDAGVTLKTVQDAAENVNRLFPLSLASEGSCRIGGNLSSNAGGVGVLSYGSARDLCLGLEVVLADGQIWNGLRSLRKDNTGYDLKHIFIGAEGTLGIITAAVLKLFARPAVYATALVAVASPQAALDLLALAREQSGGRVTAIELLPRNGFEYTMKHFGVRDPFAEPSPWYVIIEISGGGDLDTLLAETLAVASERGWVFDAAIAQSEAQRREVWSIREKIVDAQIREGGSIKHDVAVPVSHIPAFIEDTKAALAKYMPGARPMPFGHVGDGNLHFNVNQPLGMDKQAYLAKWDEMNAVVYEVVLRHGGTISAEHGIGRLKRNLMLAIKSPVELQMMRDLKRLYDPLGILNPRKMFPDA